eukprot:PITA_27590
MVEEYDSIIWNCVWDIFPRAHDKSVVSSRWLYKVKQAADGGVEKHKARFVARSLSQVEGIDYDKTFAPVARLNQAPQAWYTRINNYFTGLDFNKSEGDVNLYHIMIVRDEIHGSYALLSRHGSVAEDGEVFVSQGKYANEILRRFNMEKCKTMQTPLAVNTQPDFCFAVNELSEVMDQPTNLFWKVVKDVLRYLRGTSLYGLSYRWKEGVKLQGFTDIDCVGSPSDWKNTSGGIFNLGSVAVS